MFRLKNNRGLIVVKPEMDRVRFEHIKSIAQKLNIKKSIK